MCKYGNWSRGFRCEIVFRCGLADPRYPGGAKVRLWHGTCWKTTKVDGVSTCATSMSAAGIRRERYVDVPGSYTGYIVRVQTTRGNPRHSLGGLAEPELVTMRGVLSEKLWIVRS